ncbi:MAG: hypothetical protein JRD68_02495 [Deltaproteobacteria bacterium]|nr:hypothetical protein [Deltaproteobacteria bacterium]
MTFLSDKTIISRFYDIFPMRENDIRADKVTEPASFEMRLGGEAFLSGEKKLVKLNSKKPFLKISPGDLAILLVKEHIEIPSDLIGFISIKLSYTNMGLINISGFHVDPGFKGHLTFSVYNAGPNDIILRYNEAIFLIFFAQLDQVPASLYEKSGHEHQYQEHIQTQAMNKLGGRSVSPQSLDVRLGSLESRFQLVWGLLLALTTGLIIAIFKVFFSNG